MRVRVVTVASTFSGAGGACLGLKQAGLDVVWANEFVTEAADVYEMNFPGVVVDRRDIRAVAAADICDAAGVTEIDVLEGSPPCNSFSMSGKRDKNWGKVKKYFSTEQRSDDLFFEYARLLDGLKPKAFIAENVTGLAKGVAKGYLKQIVTALTGIGYRVEVWSLDAQFLGVAQMRPRLVFVGVRNDLTGFPEKPKPQPIVTLREAIGDLQLGLTWTPEASSGCDIPSELHQPLIGQYQIGELAVDLKPGETHAKRFNLARPAWNRPSYCLVQSTGSISTPGVIHPDGDRKYSVIEAKRISGFPDEFKLKGCYAERIERLGLSVAPPMYKAVGVNLLQWYEERAAEFE